MYPFSKPEQGATTNETHAQDPRLSSNAQQVQTSPTQGLIFRPKEQLPNGPVASTLQSLVSAQRSVLFSIPIDNSKVIDLTSDTDSSEDESESKGSEQGPSIEPSPHKKFRKVARGPTLSRISRQPITTSNVSRVDATASYQHVQPVKRGRGRPRKYPLATAPLPKPNARAMVQRPPPRPTSTPAPRPQPAPTNAWMFRHLSSPFVKLLRNLPGPLITIRNDIDDSQPPSDFTFITEYQFGPGTVPPDPEARSGCDCKPDNGRKIGCEHRHCQCLEDVARKDDGSPIGFPYYAVPNKLGCLRDIYLQDGHAIYECNELCGCGPKCKTIVVQKGRQIPLEVIKTKQKGWGLRSTVDVQKGQFIDCYLGEVITDAEADRRETLAGRGKDFYLFSLDKFQGQEGDYGYIPTEELYVVDGEFKGGITRFINHSCDPNLRICTVSFARGNPKVYQLAFFALTDIPAWTEFTFDYTNHTEDDESENEKEPGPTAGTPEDPFAGYRERRRKAAHMCHCGAKNCRGKIF